MSLKQVDPKALGAEALKKLQESLSGGALQELNKIQGDFKLAAYSPQEQSPKVTAKYGGTNVYYGVANKDVAAAASKYDNLVVEPGNFSKAPSRNAIAYVPLSGLNKDNAHHKKLFQQVIAVDGFLKDENGQPVQDPQGPGTFMIDWRKPEVKQVMMAHIAGLKSNGYNGIMFDAIDSVVTLENQKPAHFGKGDFIKGDKEEFGLTKNALMFAYEVKKELKKANPKTQIIINGGIASQYNGNDMLDMKKVIGMTADTVMVESQYSLNGSPRNNDNDKAWLVGQLSEVAKHAKDSFNFAIVDPSWQPMMPDQARKVLKDSVDFTKSVAEDVSKQVNSDEDKNIAINGSVVCTDNYTNPSTCVGNANLANDNGNKAGSTKAPTKRGR